jgi:hypothetical protein
MPVSFFSIKILHYVISFILCNGNILHVKDDRKRLRNTSTNSISDCMKRSQRAYTVHFVIAYPHLSVNIAIIHVVCLYKIYEPSHVISVSPGRGPCCRGKLFFSFFLLRLSNDLRYDGMMELSHPCVWRLVPKPCWLPVPERKSLYSYAANSLCL